MTPNPALLTVADLTTLQTKGRPDALQILVTQQGIYNWSPTGTTDGINTLAANLGGFWVRQLNVSSAHQTLTESPSITWDASKGSIADLTINSNSSIALTIMNAAPWSYGTLLVKHHLAGSTLALPGKDASSFAWAVNQDGYTELSYFYDGTTFRWVSGVFDTIPVYGVLTTAFNTYILSLGVTLPLATLSAISTYEASIRAAGLVSKMQAVYLIVGGVANTHVVNFMNPANTDAAFRGVINGVVTHSATGILPVTNGYMDSRFSPSQFATDTSCHISIYLRQNLQGNANMGVVQAVSGTGYGPELWARNASDQFVTQMKTNGAGQIIVSNADSRGMFTGVMNGSIMKSYKNGALSGTVTFAAADGVPTNNIWVGASNGTGAFSTNEFCYASIGPGFTDADAAAEYAASQALQTALSRNV